MLGKFDSCAATLLTSSRLSKISKDERLNLSIGNQTTFQNKKILNQNYTYYCIFLPIR